jgi:hypothetical protein
MGGGETCDQIRKDDEFSAWLSVHGVELHVLTPMSLFLKSRADPVSHPTQKNQNLSRLFVKMIRLFDPLPEVLFALDVASQENFI